MNIIDKLWSIREIQIQVVVELDPTFANVTLAFMRMHAKSETIIISMWLFQTSNFEFSMSNTDINTDLQFWIAALTEKNIQFVFNASFQICHINLFAKLISVRV